MTKSLCAVIPCASVHTVFILSQGKRHEVVLAVCNGRKKMSCLHFCCDCMNNAAVCLWMTSAKRQLNQSVHVSSCVYPPAACAIGKWKKSQPGAVGLPDVLPVITDGFQRWGLGPCITF